MNVERQIPETTFRAEPGRHRHLPALDGLRGFAAVLVLVHHLALAYASIHVIDLASATSWSVVNHWGHNAVLLFFCLSGLVLQVAYQRDPNVSYRSYIIRRFFRLYPTILAALGAVILIVLFLHPVQQAWMGAWLESLLDPHLSFSIIAKHLLLVGVAARDVALDAPLWSLAYEVRFSLLFPLLAVVCYRRPFLFGALSILVYVCAMALASERGIAWPYIFGWGRLNSGVITFIYLPFFGFGMLVARWIVGTKMRMPSWVEGVIAIGAISVFSFVRDQLIVVVAAIALLIAIIMGRRLALLLASTPFLWLGRISYPLYLVHVPIIYFLIGATHGRISLVATFVLAAIVSFVMAAVVHRCIELPGIYLGRRLDA